MSDDAQVNTVGAEDECSCSNRHGGGEGQLRVLEEMWWQLRTSVRALIDTAEAKDERLCSKGVVAEDKRSRSNGHGGGKGLCSKGRGGSQGWVFVLEKTQWR